MDNDIERLLESLAARTTSTPRLKETVMRRIETTATLRVAGKGTSRPWGGLRRTHWVAAAALLLFGVSMAVLYQNALMAVQVARDDSAVAKAEASRLQQRYEELLQLLQGIRIDFAKDSLDDMLRKRQEFADFIDDNARRTLSHFANPGLIALNYVSFRNATSPRLSGKVVTVGPGGDYADLVAAQRVIRSGDLIRLGKGRYELPGTIVDRKHDVALVGAGPTETTLTGSIEAAERILIAGMRIECNNQTFTNLRKQRTLHLRDCYFTGYNSGAGGSNAIFASDSILLIEHCTFEGLSGRHASSGSAGNALDLRGRYLLYVRDSEFIDNAEIIRATAPSVFDRCTSTNGTRWDFGIQAYASGLVLLRDNKAKIRGDGPTFEFTRATDDVPFVEFLLGKRTRIDEESREMADYLQLRRRLPYWIGLIRHEDPAIRIKAARRFTELSGMDVSSAALAQKEDAIAPVPMETEREYARLITWYEEHRKDLTWDEAAKRYKSDQ